MSPRAEKHLKTNINEKILVQWFFALYYLCQMLGINMLSKYMYNNSYLSAICNCLSSKASLLRVFHMASVSADISSVSKNDTALHKVKFNHIVNYILHNNLFDISYMFTHFRLEIGHYYSKPCYKNKGKISDLSKSPSSIAVPNSISPSSSV